MNDTPMTDGERELEVIRTKQRALRAAAETTRKLKLAADGRCFDCGSTSWSWCPTCNCTGRLINTETGQ